MNFFYLPGVEENMLIWFESEGVVNCVSAVKVWGLIWVNALCALVKMLYSGLN